MAQQGHHIIMILSLSLLLLLEYKISGIEVNTVRQWRAFSPVGGYELESSLECVGVLFENDGWKFLV